MIVRIPTALVAISMVVLAACAPAASPASGGPTAAPAKPAATEAAASKPAASPASSPGASPSAVASPAASPAPAAAAKPTGPAKKVRVAVSGAFLPLAAPFVAQEKGYYSEEGVDADVRIAAGLTGAQALVAGEMDFFASSATDVMLLAQRGEQMMAVVSPELNFIISLSVRPDMPEKRGVKPTDPLDKRLAALKGMTVAVSGEGSVTDTTLQLMLKQANLSPTDVKKVNIDQHPARMAALQQGQIDGFVAGSPLDVQTELSKDAVIFINGTELAEVKDYVFETIYGTKAWVESHTDETRAFNRAIVKANRFIVNDPGAIKLLRDNEFKSVPEDALTEALRRMKPGVPLDGKMTKSGWEGVMRFAIAGGLLRGPIDVSDGTVWSNKYLD